MDLNRLSVDGQVSAPSTLQSHQSRPPRSVRTPQCCPTSCASNEEMDPEVSELDDHLGRIDAALGPLLCRIHSSSEEVPFTLQILCHIVERPRASFVARGTRVHLRAATSWPVPAH